MGLCGLRLSKIAFRGPGSCIGEGTAYAFCEFLQVGEGAAAVVILLGGIYFDTHTWTRR